jgi:hypothetical protein
MCMCILTAVLGIEQSPCWQGLYHLSPVLSPFALYFVFEKDYWCLCLGWPQSHDPPAFASHAAEIIGTTPRLVFNKMYNWYVVPVLPLALVPSNHVSILCFCEPSMRLNTLCRGNHSVFDFLWVPYFTYHNILQVHPCYIIWQEFLHLKAE